MPFVSLVVCFNDVQRRAVWVTGVGCVSMGPKLHFASLGVVNASVVSDCSHLFMQFVGLLRIGRTRSSGVWQLLYTQVSRLEGSLSLCPDRSAGPHLVGSSNLCTAFGGGMISVVSSRVRLTMRSSLST
jgi:hypothetical protein